MEKISTVAAFSCALSYDADNVTFILFKSTIIIAHELLDDKFMEKPAAQQYAS